MRDRNAENGLRKDLTPARVWAFSIGTSVGWGSLVVTSNTYLAQAGILGSVLGMLAGTVIMLVISRCYSYLIQCMPEAGGAYTYTRDVFGYDYGFLTAWFLVLTYLAVFWANATALPLFARYFLGGMFRFGRLYTLFGYDVYLGEAMLSAAAVLLTAFLCSRYRNLMSAVMLGLALLFTACITIVFLGALFRHDMSWSPAYVPESGALSQIVKIAVISPWAFIGFENISHLAEEYSFNHTRVFRILVISVAATSLLYIFVTVLSVTAYPPEYDSWLAYIRDIGNLEGLKGLPAFYAADHYLGRFGVSMLMLSLLALIITSLIGNLTALSRLFYALGRDRVLPAGAGELNRFGVPGKAVFGIAALSCLIPFLGRTSIGWIVDVTTIGATMVYAFVSASARKTASVRGDRTEYAAGTAGLAAMILFAACLLVPNLVTEGSMARETYFLFIIWSVLGFLYFRKILQRDRAHRFGRSIIVWVALLALVLFIALIWMRQSMIASNHQMIANIQEHYRTLGGSSAERLEDELFIEQEMALLERANTRTILMATAMFAFSLGIMMTNYTYMNKRTAESEQIANTDPMTGVRSRHAFLMKEKELDAAISEGISKEFAIAVCDVNGLKHINDTYGHKAGDEYIRAASALICELFRHSPVFRVGGDEFAAVLTGRDYERRREILSELHERSAENISAGRVVVAGGLSVYRKGEDRSVHMVFERADSRMYSEKQELKRLGAKSR